MEMIKDLGMRYPRESSKQKRRFGLYKCPKCDEEFEAQVYNVKIGNTTTCVSCRNIKHGEAGTRLYKTWHSMKDRCYNTNATGYENYGGAGVVMCDEWLNDFQEFKLWAIGNGYSDSLTIDRVDPYGNYEPDNCRWVDKQTQSSNKRLMSTNKTGYNGVKYSDNGKRFIASISIDYKTKHIGTFDTAEEAVIARDAYVHVNNLPHKTTYKFKRIEIGA